MYLENSFKLRDETLLLNIFFLEFVKNQTVDVILGQTVYFGTEENTIFYIQLYNPQNKLVTEKQGNSVSVTINKIGDFGTWRFVYLDKKDIEPKEVNYLINMIGKYWKSQSGFIDPLRKPFYFYA